jgi:hypothetical protein
MPYTPPAHASVSPNFTGTYTPPAHAAVNFNFGIPLDVRLANATVSITASENNMWTSTLANATASISAFQSGTIGAQLGNATASMTATMTPRQSRKRRTIQAITG